jgi:N-acetylmuramoyl-L-alanine amidase
VVRSSALRTVAADGRRTNAIRNLPSLRILPQAMLGAALAIFVSASVHASGNPYFTKENGAIAARVLGERRVERPHRVPTTRRPAKFAQNRLLIVLDPGHGGKDAGAVSPDGALKEKDVALRVARNLKRILEKSGNGVKVFLTRDDDTFLALKDRTALANSLNADLFVSIHCNSNPDSSAHGVEAYYLEPRSPRGARKGARKGASIARKKNGKGSGAGAQARAPLRIESVKFARALVAAMSRSTASRGTHLENRGVRPAPMNVLAGARMPAVLVECGFMSNKGDRKKLRSPQFIDHVALSMAKGIGAYLREEATGSGTSTAIAESGSHATLRIAEEKSR